jgi:hypothetical protein
MSRAEDGRIAWRMKRPLPDGTTHLYFTGLELIRRMASLIPVPLLNLTRVHGVFAPGAQLKPWVRAGQPEQPEPEAKAAGAEKGEVEHTSNRPQRLTWAGLLRRTFELEVFACGRCGGRRRVLAYVKGAGGVRAILEHLGLPMASAHLAPARGPPQSAWC